MKKNISFTLAFLLLFSLVSCGGQTFDTDALWANATYKDNQVFGDTGTCVFSVDVEAGDKTVNFTFNTTKTTVGEAMLEYELISGDSGDYGLYVKTVNGITADYDTDKTYWAFYVGEELATCAIDEQTVSVNALYRLVYTK